MIKYLLIALSSVIIASFAQVLLKQSANINYRSKIREYLNWRVVTAYFMMFLCMLLTVFAFKGLEYKVVSIIESVGYILVTIMGRLFFNEKITGNKILGNFLIVIGIIIFFL